MNIVWHTLLNKLPQCSITADYTVFFQVSQVIAIKQKYCTTGGDITYYRLSCLKQIMLKSEFLKIPQRQTKVFCFMLQK